jgi:CII-binding regulator of phage lambda lysogenization HflD
MKRKIDAMRKIIFLLTGFLFFNFPLDAQILEKESNMSLGVQRGNEMILIDIEDKEAADLWEEYFEDRYDGKVKRNRKADEYYVTGVRINSIFSVANIDVYTKFEERGSNTMMTLWVDLGMSFVNSTDYASEYQGVIDLMEDFRIYARTYAVNKEYEEAEEVLEDLKKDLDKLEKQNGKLHEKIDDYEQKILEAKADIEQNLLDQEGKKLSIDQQIEVLKQIQIKQEDIKKMK